MLNSYKKTYTNITKESHVEHCNRGSDYIRNTYTQDALRNDLERCLNKINDQAAIQSLPQNELDTLRVEPSPTIRLFNQLNGVIISDYKSIVLSDMEKEICINSIGSTWKI